MIVDVSLAVSLFLISSVILLISPQYEIKIKAILGEKKLKIRDAVVLVALIGTLITVLAIIPQFAILVIFLMAYSIALFFFTYVLVPRWYLALLTSAIFIAFYFFYWNVQTLNVFAIIFAIAVSLYLGNVFTWKTTWIFAGLLGIVDVIQVLGTRFMVTTVVKIMNLQLPAMIILPIFPLPAPDRSIIGLGLGDLFLTGLLIMQSSRKYGRRFGFLTSIVIGVVFFIVENIIFFEFDFFPATVAIILGWLIALTPKYNYRFFMKHSH